MIPGLGAYYRPDRLEEALAFLARAPETRVLAGGTDLLLEDDTVPALLDVTRLGLGGIRSEADALVLGSTARIEEVRTAPATRDWANGVLVGACLNFGTLQVRNMATVGGNVAHALPAADLVPALLVLDATLQLARAAADGDIAWRTTPLDGFARAPFVTALLPGEIIIAVHVPQHTRTWRAQFRKIGRVTKDLAQVNCAVALHLDAGTVRAARIAVGAVHPVVTRVPAAEAELVGGTAGAADWTARTRRAVDAVCAHIQPITDMRATREWRRHVCGVLVRRSLAWVADPRHAGHVPTYDDGPADRLHADAGGRR